MIFYQYLMLVELRTSYVLISKSVPTFQFVIYIFKGRQFNLRYSNLRIVAKDRQKKNTFYQVEYISFSIQYILLLLFCYQVRLALLTAFIVLWLQEKRIQMINFFILCIQANLRELFLQRKHTLNFLSSSKKNMSVLK